VLADLHHAHLMAVPFENLTIHLGGRNVLDRDTNYQKIVVQRRGGWCYELNSTFAWLLAELGFEVTLLAAAVHALGEGFMDPFDHLALRVDLEEPWLADVGFGENFMRPLRLEPAVDQPRDGRVYRLDPDGELLVLSHDGEPDYRLSLTPRRIDEFQRRCDELQSIPGSFFTTAPGCSLALPDGRITLRGMTVLETHGGVRSEQVLGSEAERSQVLAELFGVVLPGPFSP
jgi:N-hydroxyarylamine O-acetyltransferase